MEKIPLFSLRTILKWISNNSFTEDITRFYLFNTLKAVLDDKAVWKENIIEELEVDKEKGTTAIYLYLSRSNKKINMDLIFITSPN